MSFFCLPLSAQKLTVESMELLPNDAFAASYETQMEYDTGLFAGIVKVYIALDGVEFEGQGVLKQEKRGMGEYWVWLAKDSSRLKVRAIGFLPLDVNFRSYEGVNVIHAKSTYKLVLTVPSSGQAQQDDGKSFLVMQVEPKTASVVVDDRPLTPNDGQISALMMRGSHRYKVSATGYLPQEGTVSVVDNMTPLVIRLESTASTFHVSCATSGAELYVNNQRYGVLPQTVSLFPGSYRLEARLEGYRSYREDITVSGRTTREVRIQALERLTGALRVNYLPIGGDVYVDGTKLGTSPGTFRDVGVGAHKVEIRKDGYVSAIQTVTVKENGTLDVSGELTPNSTSTIANTSNSTSTTASSAGSTSNKTIEVKGVSFTMVYVEGGTFTMGATSEQGSDAYDNEKPAHSVTLSSYYMGETEVTQALWEAVMGSNPSSFTGNTKRPVESVSWEDCQTFISKLNNLTGQQFKLPTEAQWEYAARGGKQSKGYKYSGSNNLDDVAWYDKNSYDKGSSSSDYGTHPVKMKSPNELGLYDMSGNVLEWCSDWYGNYSNNSQTNPTGASSGSDRVCRGGSSWGGSRVSFRSCGTPSIRGSFLGLRLAL